VELTLWSEAAAKFDEEALKDNPVVSIKAARVSHFGGRSLSLSGSSNMVVNPDLQDVYRLKSWYLSEGKNASVPVLSGNSGASVAAITDSDKVIDLCEVSDRQLGSDQNGAGDVFVVKATIMSIRHDFAKPPFYFACSKARDGRTCNKKASKVDSAGSEEFWCEMCNSVTEARARYILNFSLNDHTGSQFVNCFDEVGEKILGVAAGDLSKLAEGPLADEAAFGDVFLKAAFQTKLYKIKAKSENYLDEERIRCTVLAVQDIDFVNQSVKLLEKLNLMS
ncbi:60S acidic ribosomal protein P1, partial [Bonamia ostreae]